MKHELTPEVVKQIVDFAKKYEQKGDLKVIPLEVISKMLQRQYEQTGKWDVKVFEYERTTHWANGGFAWLESDEGLGLWSRALDYKDFTPFFTRYPERFESEPKYRDSLGYPLEIGEEIYVSQSIKNTLIFRYKNVFTGMVGEKFKGNFFTTKYAVSLKAYQSNPFEVIGQVKQLEQKSQPEPPKQEEKPKYRDSLGYPLEIGDDIYTDDNFMCEAIEGGIVLYFKGMKDELFFDGNSSWKYAISVKAYQNNPSEVMERIKQLEPEPMKQEEKPTKPEYVTPCGTFTEGEMVKTHQGNRIFYKYDEKLNSPYVCVLEMYTTEYKIGAKIDVFSTGEIFKLPPLPSIEEVASKAGISVEQLKDIVKEAK